MKYVEAQADVKRGIEKNVSAITWLLKRSDEKLLASWLPWKEPGP
jgi:hypothetical protein